MDTKSTFPHPVLSRIAEGTARPSFATLRVVQAELNTNALAIHANGGTGVHGHLVLVMEPAKFLIRTAGVTHDAPAFPGQHPVYAANSTSLQRSEINAIHKGELDSFHTYHNTDNALRSLLIAACPNIFIQKLKDDEHGYGGKTTLDILTHLWAEYGTITWEELSENTMRMKQPWHPPEAMETLFDQITQGAKFAVSGGSPFSDVYLMQEALHLIEATGEFTADCREWKLKPHAEKTMTNFETFFKAADTLRTATTASAGFHTANKVSANFNTTTGQVFPTTSDFAAMIAQAVALAVSQAVPSTKQQNRRPTTAPTTNTAPVELTYCWSHGFSKNKKHDSMTCENRKTGHKEEATAADTMNGNPKVYTDADKNPRRY